MRGTWRPTFSMSEGEASDFSTVVRWLAVGLGSWPADTARWCTADGPSPDWLMLLQAVDPDRQRLARIEMLRSSLRARAEEHHADDRFSFSLEEILEGGWPAAERPAGIDDLAVECLRPTEASEWSEFTILDTTGRFTSQLLHRKGDRAARASDHEGSWVRIILGSGGDWTMITSHGWTAAATSLGDGATEIRLDQTDLGAADAPRREWGQVIVRPGGVPTVELVDTKLPDGRGYIRQATASIEPGGRRDDRLRVDVRARALVLPITWNLLTPFWIVIRPFATRPLRRRAQTLLDRLRTSDAWLPLVEAAAQ